MPFTGVDFDTQLLLKTDMAYTGYFSPSQRNVIIREAITKATEFKVATNDRIQPQDDLFGIYKTNQVFTPITNEIDLIPAGSGITDYHHIMNIRARFVDLLTGLYVSGATNTTPIRLSASEECNLRTEENILVTGVTGNTNSNGLRYVKRMKNDLFLLYSDVNLLNPIAGNGVFTGTSGQVSRVVYNTAYNLKSGRKFSTLNAPTIYEPYYEIADTVMKIYPLEKTCSEITIDYISTPVYIDCGDNTLDLLTIYSQRFLDYICDESAKLMGEYIRDNELIINSSNELQQP